MSVLTEKADLSLKYLARFNENKDRLFEGSPDILNEKRKPAFQDFVLQGIPSHKNENYKYTNLNPAFSPDFHFNHLHSISEPALDEVFVCDVPQLATHLTLVSNGWFSEKNKNRDKLPEGTLLTGLENAAKNHYELVKKYYAKQAVTGYDPLVALNTAFAKDGYFLFVPRKTTVVKPIQIINTLNMTADTFVTQRNLVVIEPGSSCQLIICDHTMNLNRYLSNSVTEIYVGENAHLEFYQLQNQHNKSTNLNSVFVQQEKNSTVRSHTMSMHGGLIRNNLFFKLDGENAECQLFGMSFLDKKQHADNFIKITHSKPHCLSNQLFKNVFDEKSTGVFSGQIHVMRDAQKTNAFQRNNNLLLTDQAAVKAKPQLIIDADDVKCSHGATIGQLDEEAMFYLRSRGIDQEKARLIMMNAFAHEVVQEINVKALRERIDELIEKRLKGEVARCHNCAYNCN
ncbi:MAG: Fe-S cluster assembly protein SufD [Draconibacterium sp.]|nr:MAG: Fe-S cluster assembly protein SufD [Draconibacterium sp.]